MVVHDEPEAVSVLDGDFGTQWRAETLEGRTPTARLAAHLGVSIRFADDAQIPAGHDLLLLADAGRGLTALAALVACTHMSAEPQTAVGFGSGISDVQWMRKVTDVRAAAHSYDGALPEPIALLATLLTTAADQGVPVLIDGVVGAAAAVVAERLPELQAPSLGDEPAHRLFLDHLGIGAWGTSGIGPGQGLGALGGLGLLNLALLAAPE